MKYQRYFGITGFTEKKEVEAVLKACPIDRHMDPLLMVGVLASSKTMRGEKTEYPHRYPNIKDIPNIFVDDINCLNIIHYHPETKEDLHGQMMEVIMLGGKNCHGLQLNTAWAPAEELLKFRVFDPYSTIILQVGKGAQELCNNDPKQIAEKIADYKDLVQYILFDPSGGKGEPIDLLQAETFLETCFDAGLQEYMTFGFAGGLCTKVVPNLERLVRKYLACTDAEGKLRTADDKLILKEAIAYQAANLKFLT